jgi:hypothetical protein
MLAIASRDWEFPLFLHVLTAMILVGTVFAVAFALVFAWQRGEGGDQVTFTRFAYKALLYGVIPAWVLMRIPAQWVFEESPWGDQGFGEEDRWIQVGLLATEGGIVTIIAATILARLSLKRLERDGSDSRFGRLAALAVIGLLLLLLAAIYTMTVKPT